MFFRSSRTEFGRTSGSSFGSYNKAKGQSTTGHCLRLEQAFLNFVTKMSELGIGLSTCRE